MILHSYQTDRTRGASRNLPWQGRSASREPPEQDGVGSREPPGRGRATDQTATGPRTGATPDPESPADRRRRRALFLAELAEARRLRARVAPRRARTARLREARRMNTFRW